MKEKVLSLLRENARLTAADIALRVGLSAETVESIIRELEAAGVICGYTAILNESELEGTKVKALIEVKVTPQRDGGFDQAARRIARYPEVSSVYLVSGNFDLLVTVEGDSLQEVASFVSEKLSTIDGVLSTSTAFLLKKYKESGRILHHDEEYERLKICP